MALKCCPHCEGTGYQVAAPQPIQEYQGRRLTPKEGLLLAALFEAKGRYVTRSFLRNVLYGDPDSGSEKIIDVYVSHLRKKLAGTDFRVDSKWGYGWRVREGGEESTVIQTQSWRQKAA